jgi:hypothetical protein
MFLMYSHALLPLLMKIGSGAFERLINQTIFSRSGPCSGNMTSGAPGFSTKSTQMQVVRLPTNGANTRLEPPSFLAISAREYKVPIFIFSA